MKQFGTVLKFELKTYAKNKAFVGITIFLMLVIAVVMFLPQITSLFSSGNADDAAKDLPVMLVKVSDPAQADIAKNAFASTFTDHDVQITTDDVNVIKDGIISGNIACAFEMTDATSFTYYVNNMSLYDTNPETATRVLQQIYQMSAMLDNGMSEDAAASAMNVQIVGNVESLGKNQAQNLLYTYIMILALYMVIMLYGQMVSMSVATEKSSRAMEVLITSAKPLNMMFGKVLAACIAGLVQLIAVFGSAVLFYNINKSHWDDNKFIDALFNIPPELFAYMLMFFLLGFLIYAFLYGAISSTVSKLEDVNTAVQPVTFLFLFGFIVVSFSMNSGNVDTALMHACSYIPFTSPMAMFTRIAMSTVAWYEIVISTAILIVSTLGIGVLSAKIYRVGVLMYGTTPKIGALIKSVWKA